MPTSTPMPSPKKMIAGSIPQSELLATGTSTSLPVALLI
jgi:hypothetical protein